MCHLQVPQFVVDADQRATIVVTQPTRIAAIGAAKRVAKERNGQLGHEVRNAREGEKMMI